MTGNSKPKVLHTMYAVRRRSDNHYLYGYSWGPELKHARIYCSAGAAKGMVTRLSKYRYRPIADAYAVALSITEETELCSTSPHR